MNFATTPEQDELVAVARTFGRERLAPRVELAEEHGGLGLDCVTAGLVLEALCESPAIALTEPGGGFAIVWARTGGPGARGISAFLVPLDRPGVRTGEFEDLGGRAAGRGWLHLDGVTVPSSHLLGAEGEGFVQVMQGFDHSRALIGLQCLAVARQSPARRPRPADR